MRREPLVVVAEVKPGFILVTIVHRHRAGDVLVSPRLPQMERQAASANGPPHPRRDRIGVEPTPEQVPPQIPVRRYPQVAHADGDEDRRL